VGTQVTCGVYENCTSVYGGVPVCLSVVVVPTPRLVRIIAFIYHISCVFDYHPTYLVCLHNGDDTP